MLEDTPLVVRLELLSNSACFSICTIFSVSRIRFFISSNVCTRLYVVSKGTMARQRTHGRPAGENRVFSDAPSQTDAEVNLAADWRPIYTTSLAVVGVCRSPV
jgi:hypothetical protein